MGKFLVIDGHSLLHRAYFAIRPLSTSKGLPTNAVYGFTNMLLRIIEDEKPDSVTVTFDKGKVTFRNKIYPDYKAHRPPMPDDLRPQLPLLKDILEAMHIPYLEADNFEADDIIGTLSEIAKTNGHNTVILSGDKDILQLINPQTTALFIKKGISNLLSYDRQTMYEHLGIWPEQMADYKALVGDPSDNIPGVPGIGPKTAVKLLSAYGSLETLLSHITELPHRWQTKLQEYQHQVLTAKELATIVTDVPACKDFEIRDWQGPDYCALETVFRRLEFTSLAKRFANQWSPQTERPQAQIPQTSSLAKIMDSAHQKAAVALSFLGDTQANHLALATDEHVHVLSNCNFSLGDTQHSVQKLFANDTVAKYMHDKKTFLRMFPRLEINNLLMDTMVATYLINPLTPNRELADVVHRYLEHTLPTDNSAEAAAAHAAAIWQVTPVLRQYIEDYDLKHLFANIEIPLIDVLCGMEDAGITIDQKQLKNIETELDARIAKLEGVIHQLAGDKFNINSSQQLSTILFEKLGLKAGKKTKTGFSTDAEVLMDLAQEHKIAALILEYRQMTKLKSTYTSGIIALISPKTGRLHTTFQQTVTATGRLSSTGPNLQNIPVRMEYGRRLRKVFVPRHPNSVLLTADYSQIELRILAHLSEDEALIQAFQNNEDIHARTAAEIFRIPIEAVTPDIRSGAKAVNFGIIYGISDYGLARDLKVSRAEAKQYIDEYFKRLPQVKAFIEEAISKARKNGFVTTLFNRRRPLPEINSSNYSVRSFGERAAVNSPIQGSAADIIKSAMVEIHAALRNKADQAILVLQVHDELIFEVYSRELPKVARLIKDKMENTVSLKVPLTVDLKSGVNWYEVQKLDEVDNA